MPPSELFFDCVDVCCEARLLAVGSQSDSLGSEVQLIPQAYTTMTLPCLPNAHTCNELLEEESSHALSEAICLLHAVEELSVGGILEHDGQVLLSQEHLHFPTVFGGILDLFTLYVQQRMVLIICHYTIAVQLGCSVSMG